MIARLAPLAAVLACASCACGSSPPDDEIDAFSEQGGRGPTSDVSADDAAEVPEAYADLDADPADCENAIRNPRVEPNEFRVLELAFVRAEVDLSHV